MKRMLMLAAGAVLVLSLAACTPTPEKGRTGEVAVAQSEAANGNRGNIAPTQAGNGVATDRFSDPTAPDVDVVSVYTVSEDGTKVEGTIDAVEETTPQTLVDLLIQYGTLEEGTEVLSFETGEISEEEEVGPGVVKIPGMVIPNDTIEDATLNLSKFPDKNNDLLIEAVMNTFTENLQILHLTILENGEFVAGDQAEEETPAE